jgi:hypothetical protein
MGRLLSRLLSKCINNCIRQVQFIAEVKWSKKFSYIKEPCRKSELHNPPSCDVSIETASQQIVPVTGMIPVQQMTATGPQTSQVAAVQYTNVPVMADVIKQGWQYRPEQTPRLSYVERVSAETMKITGDNTLYWGRE